jgi:hypothetical protein
MGVRVNRSDPLKIVSAAGGGGGGVRRRFQEKRLLLHHAEFSAVYQNEVVFEA